MKNILFPSQYKSAIKNGRKKWTLRINNEQGKYKKGKVYNATSYSDQNWGVRLKIIEVITLKANQLLEHGIPKKSVQSIFKREDVKENSVVDIVKFERV